MSLAKCPELRFAELSWCIQLTDGGVCALAAGSRNLEVLSLHGILGITDKVIDALAASCSHSLHSLDVNGCTGIEYRSEEQLTVKLPNLRTFILHT